MEDLQTDGAPDLDSGAPLSRSTPANPGRTTSADHPLQSAAAAPDCIALGTESMSPAFHPDSESGLGPT